MNAAKSRSFPAWRRRVTRRTITSTWYADRSRARTERITITQKANNRSHKREGPVAPVPTWSSNLISSASSWSGAVRIRRAPTN